MESAMHPAELGHRWREEASILRRRGAASQACLLESCADELEKALRETAGMLLSLADAARATGYSPDHLGRLVKAGKVHNYGRPNAPRVRLADLPTKRGRLLSGTMSPHRMGATRRETARAVVAT